MILRKSQALTVGIAAALLGIAVYFMPDGDRPFNDAAQRTIRAYLKATYARDFKDAYRYLSPADQKVRDEQSFIDSNGSYGGFTLKVARTLANYMEVWPIEQTAADDRLRITVGYRVPAPADLAGLLLNWDEAELNALPQDRQRQILAKLEAHKRAGKLLFIEGQKSFDLINEQHRWKIFIDWASATKVKLKAHLPNTRELDVRFAETDVFAKHGELFLVNLIVKNRVARALTFTVRHRVDPQPVADGLELVECGLLTPVTLQAGREQEFSMAYLLSSAARQNYREINLTYEFKVK